MTRIALLALLMIGQAAQTSNLMPMQPSAKPVVVPVLPQNQRHEEVKPCSKDDRDGVCNYNNFPDIVSTQAILDPVQARYPGNEWVKRCSPTNHDAACFDPKMPHIVSHLYVVSKEACERHERVECEELPSCSFSRGEKFDFRKCRTWIPIGKPVFEAETSAPTTIPVAQTPVIHPTMYVGYSPEESEEMSRFVNSFVFSCPKGYAPKDAKHLLHAHMTYKDVLNGLAQLTCVKADGGKK